MKYGILLWPHTNSRYQEAVLPLSVCELSLMLSGDLDSEPRVERIAGAQFLCFDSALGPDAVCEALRDHAHLFLLTELKKDGGMMPVGTRREAYLGEDLPGILKYKGKTNEVFTRFLINMALYSSAFRHEPRIRMFDPMCGRGTALFEAVNRGWDAVGSDINRQDIHEAEVFFKRYLEYHKFKHQLKQSGMTLPGKRSVARKQALFANVPEAFKAGDVRELSLINADIADVCEAFPQKSFHISAIDLPYGVQHDSAARGKPEPLDKLLGRALPGIRRCLLPGSAVALSFNVNNLPRERALALLEQAGFEPMRGPCYDRLAHWVEQAVTRDLAVGVRKN